MGSAWWYEKITTSYTFNALAQTSFLDTGFHLSQLGLSDFRWASHHSIPISASYTVARYINFSASINYNEYWLTEQFYQYYNTGEGKVDTILNKGFFATRDLNATAQFPRAYMASSAGGRASWRAFVTCSRPMRASTTCRITRRSLLATTTRLTLHRAAQVGYYSPYNRSVVGIPGLGQYGRFASTLNFGLNNNLQIKTRSGCDTGAVTKNITLIDGLSLNSGYNLAADSFGWAGVNMQFRTNVLDKISVNASANFTPYVYDNTLGRTINKLRWNDGGLLNFQNANLSFSSSFHSGTKDKGAKAAKKWPALPPPAATMITWTSISPGA